LLLAHKIGKPPYILLFSPCAFHIFSYLGPDLPGALVAAPMKPDEVPDEVLRALGGVKAIELENRQMMGRNKGQRHCKICP
jgi:hypothetical protein